VIAEDAKRRIVAEFLAECVFYGGLASVLGGDNQQRTINNVPMGTTLVYTLENRRSNPSVNF
jgi:hypothetical protein